ncbi:C-X-C chemokine receptor type 5 isoform X2 [Ambystoma mexicanum]|uniref:C-X-C chemokine receptor type 5 isoform X2 n=1 Tax=Ambystoma mexicanum TaxID=8296 RepID=UPI0037E93EEA
MPSESPTEQPSDLQAFQTLPLMEAFTESRDITDFLNTYWDYFTTHELNYNDSNPTFPPGYVCPDLELSSRDGAPGFSSFRKHFILWVYLTVFILGAAGNGLLLVILMRYQHARRLTENYLLHLAAADLLMLLTFPFAVVEFLAGWVFGEFLCKTVYTIHKVNFFCSSLLLGCIGVDRYLAVVHAVHTYNKRKPASTHLTCLVVWLLCLLLAAPYFFTLEVSDANGGSNVGHGYDANASSETYHNHGRCVYSHFSYSSGWWHANRFVYHLVGFLLPLLVMTFCYAAIVRVLCHSQRFEKRKAVRVALAITGVFFLCWTPYNVTIFLDTLLQLEAIQGCGLSQHLPGAILVTEGLGFLHCCLNPVLYAFVSVKFRHEMLRVLEKGGCLGPRGLQRVLNLDRRSSGTDSENATSLSTF